MTIVHLIIFIAVFSIAARVAKDAKNWAKEETWESDFDV